MNSYEEAIQKSYEQPVMILFTATWCGPCKIVKPLIERLQAELNFPLAKLDADENKEILAAKGIRGVPTILIVNGGTYIQQLAGVQAEAKLRGLIEAHGLAPKKGGLSFDDEGFETVYGAGGVGEVKK